MNKALACAALIALIPLSGCAILLGTADAVVSVTTATVGAAVKVGGAVVDAVIPDGDDK